MELNITRFFNAAEPSDYSASVAELGPGAARITWRAAVAGSADYMLLDTDTKREAFRAFALDSGGWDRDEIAAWSDTELNALCLQWIAGDMREGDLGPDMLPSDWERYEKLAERGQVSSRIFRGVDGEVYIYIGS